MPAVALDAARHEHNTTRLHTGIGYVTRDDENPGAAGTSARPAGVGSPGPADSASKTIERAKPTDAPDDDIA